MRPVKPVKPLKLVATSQRTSRPDYPEMPADSSFEAGIMHLVSNKRERWAIKSGEVDAIVDPVSCRVILFPRAQMAMRERKLKFHNLLELESDGYWQQDNLFRFIADTGAFTFTDTGQGSDANLIGKTFWDLPLVNRSSVDWQTHRTQLEWRAIFRDMELGYVNHAGEQRVISVSGEPMYDEESRFTGYHGITRDITARKLAEAVPPESDRFASATLDALAARVCVLDENGTIIGANHAWRSFSESNAGCGAGAAEGDNYLAACGQHDGNDSVDLSAMAAGIRQVITGKREQFQHEYTCVLPAGQQWFMVTVTRILPQAAARAIVSCVDVTGFKRVEQLLRLEHVVASSLADADNTAAGIQAVIRTLCVIQQWDCGCYFQKDHLTGGLTLVESWGMPAENVQQLMTKSANELTGKVCETGQLFSLASGAANVTVPQTAVIDGALVFPVCHAGSIQGALAFAGSRMRSPDNRLLQAVKGIGRQLGEYLHRQHF